MINIEDQYFSISKSLLLAIGLWPSRQTRLTHLQHIFFFGLFSTAIVFQLTTFITAECTLKLVIKVLSSVLTFFNVTVQYFSFQMKNITVKILLQELQHTCDKIKDKNELAIIRKYANISRHYTTYLTTAASCAEVVFILVQFWTIVPDFVQSRNESRSHNLIFPMEYFVDHQRYHYLILLHVNAAICIGVTAILSTGSLFIAFQKCICGMFTIASYRIKCVTKMDTPQTIKPGCRNMNFAGIVSAVEIHRTAMKFSIFLVSQFEMMLCILVTTIVCSLSLNLFQYVRNVQPLIMRLMSQIFLIMTSEPNVKELLLPTGAVMIDVAYMFLANYVTQDLTDHNRRIFATAYNVRWYKTPVAVQKLILFLLQRGTKDFTVSIGGLIDGSLECFASLVNISLSYFTVLYSTQR